MTKGDSAEERIKNYVTILGQEPNVIKLIMYKYVLSHFNFNNILGYLTYRQYIKVGRTSKRRSLYTDQFMFSIVVFIAIVWGCLVSFSWSTNGFHQITENGRLTSETISSIIIISIILAFFIASILLLILYRISVRNYKIQLLNHLQSTAPAFFADIESMYEEFALAIIGLGVSEKEALRIKKAIVKEGGQFRQAYIDKYENVIISEQELEEATIVQELEPQIEEPIQEPEPVQIVEEVIVEQPQPQPEPIQEPVYIQPEPVMMQQPELIQPIIQEPVQMIEPIQPVYIVTQPEPQYIQPQYIQPEPVIIQRPEPIIIQPVQPVIIQQPEPIQPPIVHQPIQEPVPVQPQPEPVAVTTKPNPEMDEIFEKFKDVPYEKPAYVFNSGDNAKEFARLLSGNKEAEGQEDIVDKIVKRLKEDFEPVDKKEPVQEKKPEVIPEPKIEEPKEIEKVEEPKPIEPEPVIETVKQPEPEPIKEDPAKVSKKPEKPTPPKPKRLGPKITARTTVEL